MVLSKITGGRITSVQSLVALCLLAVTAGTGLVIELASRNARLAEILERHERDYCLKTKNKFPDAGYFIEFSDRMVYEELPKADYSKGGFYLIGSSGARLAANFRNLAPTEQALIHNYGLATGDHSREFQLLRFLIEHEGFLRAGGDKTLVCFAVNADDAGNASAPEAFIKNLWERHGLYRYSNVNGIIPIAVNPLVKLWHFEKLRMAGCVRQVGKDLVRQCLLRLRGADKLERKQDKQFVEWMHLWPEAKWNNMLNEQVAEFARMADYLLVRNVRVAVVFLPCGTWESQRHYMNDYMKAMTALCETRQIPAYDWSKALSDEDFGDAAHVNVAGADKLQPRFLEIARPFLHSTGALR